MLNLSFGTLENWKEELVCLGTQYKKSSSLIQTSLKERSGASGIFQLRKLRNFCCYGLKLDSQVYLFINLAKLWLTVISFGVVNRRMHVRQLIDRREIEGRSIRVDMDNQLCEICNKHEHIRLCDFATGTGIITSANFREITVTCVKKICANCAVRIWADCDVCPEHAKEVKNKLSKS